MTRRARNLGGVRRLLAGAAAGACAACGPTARPPVPAGVLPAPGVLDPGETSEESWSFEGAPGRILRTRSYAIYTTQDGAGVMQRLPDFLERALDHYTTVLTPDVPLARPEGRMDTFLMANRGQWQSLTLRLVGPAAQDYQSIRAGGFAVGGRAFYFDIGPQGSLMLAAHEGWHQFSQRTFRSTLPVWMEEGIATFMEGFRWDGLTPEFGAWVNLDRFDQLRAAAAEDRLLTLGQLLDAEPRELVQGDERGALTYYAQVWALTLYLREGGAGRHAGALRVMVREAQSGRMPARVARAVGMQEARRSLGQLRGDAVFRAYFGEPGSHEAPYRAFIDAVVRPGSRQRIAEGRSPLE